MARGRVVSLLRLFSESSKDRNIKSESVLIFSIQSVQEVIGIL